MNGQSVLQMHPSVQDLTIDTFKVNPAKAHYHSLVINNTPLHAPSDIVVARKPKKLAMLPNNSNNNKKDQTKAATPADSIGSKSRGLNEVQVVRNEENLRLAALARMVPSEVNVPPAGQLPPVVPKKQSTLKSKQSTNKSELNGSTTGGSAALNAETLRELEAKTALAEAKKLGEDGLSHEHRPSSLVTSKVSFEATDAESFSVYSCSCCHAKPLSSHLRPSTSASSKKAASLRHSIRSATPLSQYENMTSVSQRPSNHPSQASVTSTKLRTLEAELIRERESRQKTLSDLEAVRKRQQLLLSKLTPAEREQFKELLSA